MSFKPTSVPTKRLSASITSTQLTFKLDDIIGWNGVALTAADFGTQGYGVFRNGRRDLIEIFEFDPATIASSSITIVRRGLKFDGDATTEVAGNKLEWTAGDTFVDLGTDTPQLWQWLKTYVDNATYAGLTQPSFDAFLAASSVLSVKTLIPKPVTDPGVPVVLSVVTNTTAQVGMVEVTKKITVNSISFRTGTVTVAGTVKISLYSEDGQTQIFSVTTASLTADTIITTAVAAVVLPIGNYYIVIQPVGPTNAQVYAWTDLIPFAATLTLLSITSEYRTSGTITVTADTPPTTFNPASDITVAIAKTLVFRLDN